MSRDFTPKSQRRLSKFAKYKGTAVLVHINEFNEGTTFVDIRQFQQDQDGEYLPTSKGLSIHRDHVVKLRQVLDRAIKKLGLDADEPQGRSKKRKK